MGRKKAVSVLALTALSVSTGVCGGIEAIQKLKFENGQISRIISESSPIFTDSGGKEYRDLPPRVIVRLCFRPAPGSCINVEIWLPEPAKWNGRFVGLGNGGAAGSINPAGMIWPVMRGCAAAATDMGTAPDPGSGVKNPEVWKDFGYRATHLMTTAAQAVIRAYYGKQPDYSYFCGGSTGGQQALQEAQRYPGDYDGILAQVPAHCRTPLHAYFLWNYQILQRCPFTAEQEAAVVAAGNEYMANRELPQTAGRIVSDPRCTSADIEAVIALACRKEPSLTKDHAAALRKLFNGPVHSVTGERIFNGIPFGASFALAQGNLYLFHWVFGADQDLTTLDFGKDIDTYTAALGPYLNAENPDLRAFERHGGKLLMYSGSADACVPYHATLAYYERVIEVFGSLETVRHFFRYYLIPGMDHVPGPGINTLPDLFSTLVNWREAGNVPEALPGKRLEDGREVFGFPIFPYPQKTVYDADTGTFRPENGFREGVAKISISFLPSPAE